MTRIIVGHSAYGDWRLTFIDTGPTRTLDRDAAEWLHGELGRQLGRPDQVREANDRADRHFAEVERLKRSNASLRGAMAKRRKR